MENSLNTSLNNQNNMNMPSNQNMSTNQNMTTNMNMPSNQNMTTNMNMPSNDIPSKVNNYISILMNNKIYLFIIIAVIFGILYYLYNKNYIGKKKDLIKIEDDEVNTENQNQNQKTDKPNKDLTDSEKINEIMNVQKYLLEQEVMQKKIHQDIYQKIMAQQQFIQHNQPNQQQLHQQQHQQQQQQQHQQHQQQQQRTLFD